MMKKALWLFLAMGMTLPLWAAWGGPDSFGYIWVDCDEPGGPAYQWTEIRALGASLSLGDDESQQIALPQPFRFYGTQHESLFVCSNGFLSLSSPEASPYPAAIPNGAPPNGLAAPLWNDLNPADPASGGIYTHYDSAAGRFLVEWDSVVHFGTQHFYSFQAVLDFSDNSLFFQYRSAWPGWQADAAVAGIEDQAGGTGLELPGNLPRDEYSVVFLNPPDSHDVQAARVSTPRWWVEPESLATPGLVAYNAGLAEASFPAVCRISRNDTLLYADTSFVYQLAPGDSTSLGFEPWPAGHAGESYEIVMYCDYDMDGNRGNDTLVSQTTAFPYRNKISSQWRQGAVVVDGVLSPGEWPEDGMVDASDILGKCGGTVPPGSALLYAQNDSSHLYLALDAPGDAALEDGDAWTLRMDDDGDGAWAGGGVEGRYRLAYSSGDVLDFTGMPGGAPVPAPGVQRASSASSGRLQREMAIPLGGAEAWQLFQVPGGTSRAQSSAEDAAGPAIAWWPQDMDAADTALPSSYGLLHLAVPPTGLEGKPPVSVGLPGSGIRQNSPNPFSRQTRISFRTTAPGLVTMKVFNIAGQEVKNLITGHLEPGAHAVEWDATNQHGVPVASGVYFCRMEGWGRAFYLKMQVIR